MKFFTNDDFSAKNLVGLNIELKCIYINELFNKTQKSILVITSSIFETQTLYQALIKHNQNVDVFMMDDFLTSEAIAISPEFKINRLETMDKLLNNPNRIVITNLMGYLRYLPTPDVFKKSILTLKKGEQFDIKELSSIFYTNGYKKETLVAQTGDYSTRGYVIDVFPINTEYPIRIEFWGDTIESLRYFDIDTQRTINEIEIVQINPNHEFLTLEDVDHFGVTQKDLIKYGNVVNIKTYLDNPLVIFNDYPQIVASNHFLEEEIFNYRTSQNLSTEQTFMLKLSDLQTGDEKNINQFHDKINDLDETIIYQVTPVELTNGNVEHLLDYLTNYSKKYTVVVCLSTFYKLNKLTEMIDEKNVFITNEDKLLPDKLNFIVKDISEGFIFKNYAFIGEKELFGKKDSKSSYKTNYKFGKKINDINKLNIGDYVVHSVHGIGLYSGLATIVKAGVPKDYLQVVYSKGDKLYIPVEKIDYITKYSSSDGAVPKVSKLGGTDWQKTKLKARKRAENIAHDLLKLYAEREAKIGFAFPSDDENQLYFEKEFKYNETIDQLRAVDDIKKDMESAKVMDRLICGDVGFGKTEVAFRAMFKAILAGKQIMFLCPTTILSRQHYLSAIERFKSFPINIALLNRFVTAKETKGILEKIRAGKIDIVIGTHRLLSSDIVFKDLGLLVVDEEQRFGVKHKEIVKQIKTNVDVLTLTATPIPRTIQMTLAGIRDLSLIETPPLDRYPVQTYVLSENNQIIKDAIYKELSRGGQVFLLYNHIANIDKKMAEISKLVPESKVISAHGQMPKHEIEDVMFKFINNEYNVLVCTTIIETGIDIPSVNTLIIIDADRFGLSQLYQIRGRVGRSNKIAYCYLMYNKNKILSEIATKRLKVIKDFTELGSGFAIAMRDLALRGSGDILGQEQAGFIDTVGIELFGKMLNEEIAVLKGEVVESDDIEEEQPLINVSTAIPSTYVQEEELKIEIHQKINKINSIETLNAVKNDIEDRFGSISDEMIVYMHQELFEKEAKALKIKNVRQIRNSIEILLSKDDAAKYDMAKLFVDVTKLSDAFSFSKRFNQVLITLNTSKLDKHFVYYLLDLMRVMKNSIND